MTGTRHVSIELESPKESFTTISILEPDGTPMSVKLTSMSVHVNKDAYWAQASS